MLCWQVPLSAQALTTTLAVVIRVCQFIWDMCTALDMNPGLMTAPTALVQVEQRQLCNATPISVVRKVN